MKKGSDFKKTIQSLFDRFKSKSHKEKEESESMSHSIIRKVIIFFLICFVTFPFVTSIYLYIALSKITFENQALTREFPDNVTKNKTNVLLVGTDSDESGREFIDFLSILQIDRKQKELRILNINPKFIALYISDSENLTFKNLLATEEKFNDLSGVDLLVDRIERFAAMRIDGYVMLSEGSFKRLFDDFGEVEVLAPSTLTDQDITSGLEVRKGNNKISMDNFVDFVSADANGQDDRQARQLSAMQSLIFEPKMIKSIFKLTPKTETISNEVKTNYDVFEIIRFWVWAKVTKPTVIVGYVHSHPGYVLETAYGTVWRPIYENIDRDIRDVFTNKLAKIEQAKIDILNSTDSSGLATSRGRWMETRGLRVVVTGNENMDTKVNQLFVEDPTAYPWTIYEIGEALRGDLEIVEQRYPNRSVGDMVLVLGDNEVLKQ